VFTVFDEGNAEFIKAGVKEYWIIHPVKKIVTIFLLNRGNIIARRLRLRR